MAERPLLSEQRREERPHASPQSGACDYPSTRGLLGWYLVWSLPAGLLCILAPLEIRLLTLLDRASLPLGLVEVAAAILLLGAPVSLGWTSREGGRSRRSRGAALIMRPVITLGFPLILFFPLAFYAAGLAGTPTRWSLAVGGIFVALALLLAALDLLASRLAEAVCRWYYLGLFLLGAGAPLAAYLMQDILARGESAEKLIRLASGLGSLSPFWALSTPLDQALAGPAWLQQCLLALILGGVSLVALRVVPVLRERK